MSAHRAPRTSTPPSLTSLKLLASTDEEHPARLASLVLRSRSPVALDALAERAGAGPGGMDDLRRPLAEGRVPRGLLTHRSGPYAVALSTALAGLRPAGPDAHLAVRLAASLVTYGDPGWWWPRAETVAVQNAVLCGARDEATQWLDQLAGIPQAVRWGTRADLANPYLPPDGAGADRSTVTPQEHAIWEEALSVAFLRGSLAPLHVDPRSEQLFDGLSAPSRPGSIDGPLVTVVMPTYAPDAGLLTAVRSLLAQSYGNQEILLVDDCSGSEYAERYEEAAALDPRITLLRMPVNGGSYLGRNAAMARARGAFITFQDGDDWSHPERLAQQVAALQDQPDRPASISRAVRATDDLAYTWLGFSPQRDNASSLMVTRSTLDRLGPFQQVRKGADSEYHRRIEAVLGELAYVRRALAVTRLRGGSLSRSDFTLEWHTPDRVTYRNVFGHWHRTLAAQEVPLRAGPSTPQPFPPPRSFLRDLPGAPPPPTRYALGYLLDASLPHPLPGASLPAAVAVAARLGRPAVVHREDFGRGRARWAPFVPELLELVQTGEVDLVNTTDRVHLDTLVVLTPGSMELRDDMGISCTTDRVIVVLPLPDQDDYLVDLAEISDTCQAMLGRRPQWAALDHGAAREWSLDGWDLPLLVDLVAEDQEVASSTSGTS